MMNDNYNNGEMSHESSLLNPNKSANTHSPSSFPSTVGINLANGKKSFTHFSKADLQSPQTSRVSSTSQYIHK